MAAIFSATIRWYSAALHVPRAIIAVRWKIVSHDAAVIWAIMPGRPTADRRERFLIRRKMSVPALAHKGCMRPG